VTETRRIIGVTGPIACGKSSVMAALADHGAVTIDADLVYRDLIKPAQPLTRTLAGRFGAGILTEDGEINRRALGTIVFSDPAALADLDRLTHPAIVAEIERRIETIDAPLIAIEAVKLSQGGVGRICDETWLVLCDHSLQIERLMQRNGIPREDAERRIAAQTRYDHGAYTRVIENNCDRCALDRAVITALEDLHGVKNAG
jgi:dephospho-CoA kinase